MMGKYMANIDVTVNGKKFMAGEEITEGIAPRDREFLLREDYIGEIPAPPGKAGRREKPVKEEGAGKPEQPPEEAEEPGK